MDNVNRNKKNVIESSKAVEKWLGDGYNVRKSPGGDAIFTSKDGLRQFRTNHVSPHGYEPHVHIRVLKDGKWVDATEQHMIFIKP